LTSLAARTGHLSRTRWTGSSRCEEIRTGGSEDSLELVPIPVRDRVAPVLAEPPRRDAHAHR
jgi:hypothetical protein